jgi:anaerobic sulfite reductase subunit C
MSDTEDPIALKKRGFIPQRQKGFCSARLHVRAGYLTAAQLRGIEAAADRYGRGLLHVTTRQGLAIPWAKPEDYEALKADLAGFGLALAGAGPKVRALMCCPGSSTCAYGLVDTVALVNELDSRFFGLELPVKKLKIAVCGCPNSCTAPQLNDIGLMGIQLLDLDIDACTGCALCAEACKEKALSIVAGLPVRDEARCLLCGACASTCPVQAWRPVKTGYAVFVGGKVGRHPQFGVKMIDLLDPQEVPDTLQRIVSFVQQVGSPKERFGATLNRLGTVELRQYLGLEPVDQTG